MNFRVMENLHRTGKGQFYEDPGESCVGGLVVFLLLVLFFPPVDRGLT